MITGIISVTELMTGILKIHEEDYYCNLSDLSLKEGHVRLTMVPFKYLSDH